MTAPNPGRLAELLDVYRTRGSPDTSAEESAIFAEESAWLRHPGWDDAVPLVGDAAPDAAMPDAVESSVSLLELAAAGPLVLKFYRGRWCPYCTLDLRAWQRAAPEVHRLGARFVAVTPQSETEIALFCERDGLSFHVVSDPGMKLARAYGVAYEISQAVREVYLARGVDHSATHASGDWMLPLPACFVIGRDGRVAWCHFDTDYTRRAEPAEVLAVLGRLAGG